MSADSQSNLAEKLSQLEAENESLKAQMAEPDLKAFEQIKELRSQNRRLSDEVKRLTGDGVQLAFKNRQLDQQVKKLQAELASATERGQTLDHSLEELKGELGQSREQVLSHAAELERQKSELAQRQLEMGRLQEDLGTREARIAQLEKLVFEFKEQFLSGEFEAVSLDEPESPGGEAYQVLSKELGERLGIPGTTLVDQNFELLELSRDCQDLARLEELFEVLQDVGSQLFASEPEYSALKEGLTVAWAQISESPLPSVAAEPRAGESLSFEPEVAPDEHEPPVEVDLDLEIETEEPLADEAVPLEAEVGKESPRPLDPEQWPKIEVEEIPPVETSALDELEFAEEETEEEGLDLDSLLDEGMSQDPGFAEVASGADEPPAVVVELEVESTSVDGSQETEEEVDEAALEDELEALLGEDSMEEFVAAEAAEAWAPPQARAKEQQISEGLALLESDLSLAQEMLEQALEVEVYVENESEANLALLRLKPGRESSLDFLYEALTGVEIGDLFSILAQAQEGASGPLKGRLELFEKFANHSRADLVAAEAAQGLGKRALNREFVSQLGNDEEEELVAFLRDTLIERSGLKLPVPSERFEGRLESTGPAAFVGTLRQALRAVDYTLFDFADLKVLTYDGEDTFLVDASAEPELTLVFHRDIEGMPPEELCFLVFRHLVRMYRGHDQLEHQSLALDASARLQLTRTVVELYLEEAALPHSALGQRLEELSVESAAFEADCKELLLHLYQATGWEYFLYTREFLFDQVMFRKRLNPVADHMAARLVGATAATFACLREELLGNPDWMELCEEGLEGVFAELSEPALSPARLRVQRLWNEFLLEL